MYRAVEIRILKNKVKMYQNLINGMDRFTGEYDRKIQKLYKAKAKAKMRIEELEKVEGFQF